MRRDVRVGLEGSIREVLVRARVRGSSEVGWRRGEKARAERLAGCAGREALKLRRVRKRVRRMVGVRECIMLWLLLF